MPKKVMWGQPLGWRVRSILALAAVVLMAGCAAAPAEEPVAPAATSSLATSSEATIDVSYAGRLPEQVCTFGDVRHACDPVPGSPPSENILMELPAGAVVSRIIGTIALEEMPAGADRVDLFLFHRVPGGDWMLDFPNDPYVSGRSPQPFDWDLAPYAGEEFALYVFASTAAGAGPVGVSHEPSQPFAVTASLTLADA